VSRQSLIEFLREYAAKGDEVAFRQRVGYRMESWTYAQIAAAANRTARELESRGVGQGDSAVLWGENSPEWVVAFFGCVLRGVVVVPMDLGSTPEFVARVVRETKAKLIFRSRDAAQGASAVPAIELERLTEVAAKHDAGAYSSPALGRDDTLQIIFTSGTTAEPRGVVITHGNVLANFEPIEREIAKYIRYEKPFHPLRFLNLLPLSHVFGQMLGMFIPPLLNATVVLTNSLKPSELSGLIRRERVSVLVAVPRLIEALRRDVLHDEDREGSTGVFYRKFETAASQRFLRRWWTFRKVHRKLGWKFWAIISGGAALPEDLETFWNRLGYAVIQGYGMTETTSLISLNHPFHSAQGSLGKVFPGMEVRIDEHGEILVRGENVAKTYSSGGSTQRLADADGWFRTGDLAETDDEGRLYFKGRKKNVIVTPAGMNVYPEDLEKALRAQEGVRDCVVLGIENGGNAEACAVLLLAGRNGSGESVVSEANRSLAEYQRIRRWFVWTEPDFPRTPTQKPLLSRIREVVSAEQGSGPVAGPRSADTVQALIAEITGRRATAGSADASLDADLRMSSLDRVELLDRLEERYQVNLSETQFAEATTVRKLEQLLREPARAAAELMYPSWPQSWPIRILRLAVYYLVAWPATYLLAGPRVRGRENLRDVRGPVLVIANHVTYLDIAWVLAALPWRPRNRLATGMRGERLAEMRNPPKSMNIFGRALERLNYFLALTLFNVFPLPQRSGFAKSFSHAGDLADRGWSVLIFPEGKTTDDGQIAPFRSGIGLLAQKLNIPVVPMRLDGLLELREANRILARPGQVRVTIGPPVRFRSDQDPEEIAQELERRVREL
jgi:long-chain acyl-CoA synthetase